MGDSESREMYLKSIFELEDGGEPVPVSLVAKRLGFSSVSATEMMKRLESNSLVVHSPYKGYALSAKGRKRAASVVRRQRLWGRFLGDHLGIPWAEIYDFACSLEHATNSKVTEALAEFLGHPEKCPHGNTIPEADGHCEADEGEALSEAGLGKRVRIERIAQPETALCDYLAERKLLPGAILSTIEQAPFNGPLTVAMEGKEIALGREMAARIFVVGV